ncbi:hypothetical protein [Streptomyces sp. NPDC008125]|uniref:hypothetical protein n=1 Tax=Streptomyces sp. NPDC008125 TaxID=3364811 RepID=UPI0036EFDA63
MEKHVDISQLMPSMGDEEVAAYRLLVVSGGVTMERLARKLGWGTAQTERVLATLRKLRLVRPCTDSPSDWEAVHPEMARFRYTKPLEGAIDAWQAQLDGFRRQLDALTTGYDDGSTIEGVNHIVPVVGASDVRDVLDDAAARCTEEVLAVQPLGREPSGLGRNALSRHLGLLGRSVRVRVLFPHLSRYDAQTREYVERVTAADGEVRTSASPLPALVVFDRSVAFLLDNDGRGTEKAQVVKNGALVDFIVRAAEGAWATGADFQGAGGNNRIPEQLTHQTKAAIIQLLAAGYKDEVVARRLGIAVRTCRKYIAEIFDDLGAQSRFQAGWLVRQRMLAAGGGDIGEEATAGRGAA